LFTGIGQSLYSVGANGDGVRCPVYLGQFHAQSYGEGRQE
jgi:hypothetical protein